MQIMKIDEKNATIEVVPDSFDDLWHLEKIIEKGDLVSGSSERKIKPKTEGEKAFRQKIFVTIEAEKTEFQESTNQLRVQGVITDGKPVELIEIKSHHTIEVEPKIPIKIQKKKIKTHHIERLERAKKASNREKLLLIVMDDEGADLAFLKDNGLDMKTKINAGKQGKRFDGEKGKKYFEELLKKIEELEAKKIIIAGPGFEKQNFEKFIVEKNPKIKPNFEATNSTGITGFNELIKSGKIDALIKEFHSAKEAKAMEEIMQSVNEEKAAIGFGEVEKAVEAGAAEQIAMSENTLSEKKEKAEELLEKAEQQGSSIIFVESKSDAGKQLEGLGGVAAKLRYKLFQ